MKARSLSARIRAIVRQFPQNGLKLLFEQPYNVRDLLALTELEILDLIDFDRMTLDPTTFVQRDYRHVEADLVLRVPLRRSTGRRQVTIYILLEHQSEPDRLMVLRLIDYVIQIYKSQVRTWDQQHPSSAGLRLQPVLPVVLYTGKRPWPALGQLLDLVEMGAALRNLIPGWEPLFLNLSALSEERLESAGGFFGWVLHLVQQRNAQPAEFQKLLGRVVEHLETMPPAERVRWLELLSYVHALVYHTRNPEEHVDLQEVIDGSVQTEQHRQEVTAMGKTIAEELKTVGRKEGRKEGELRLGRRTLLQLLRQRFGNLPAQTVAVVEATTSVEQLEVWLGRVVAASSLTDMGIA